ncbi:DUF763 domain-containing protein [Candidatus Bipolaricaulota bacterium]|nr:DUF763 domain-containing protein [Candidatus Bipolaricaulota bacterium]
MKRVGTADLPLHWGQAPRWLFRRMAALSEAILWALVDSFGTKGVLERLSDPYWFQALGCLLGFDWHSSGLTTTTCGALKEALKRIGSELGLFAAGGKGATSRRTPDELAQLAGGAALDPEPLIYASRMTAKVDSACLQDGYQIYHHVFFFDREGRWCVVQQGMDPTTRMARRYHWISEGLSSFVEEPHKAVVGEKRREVLNLVAREAAPARETIPELVARPPEETLEELRRIPTLVMPHRHRIVSPADLSPRGMRKVLLSLYERAPRDFQEVLATPGLGPKSLRALALVSELIWGAPASIRDPARFAYAHGGKDGTPYPVDRATYDKTIASLRKAILQAKVGRRDRLEALRRLHRLFPPGP